MCKVAGIADLIIKSGDFPWPTNIEEFFLQSSVFLVFWEHLNGNFKFFLQKFGRFLFLLLLEMETEILIISFFSGLHRFNFRGRINLTQF